MNPDRSITMTVITAISKILSIISIYYLLKVILKEFFLQLVLYLGYDLVDGAT